MLFLDSLFLHHYAAGFVVPAPMKLVSVIASNSMHFSNVVFLFGIRVYIENAYNRFVMIYIYRM